MAEQDFHWDNYLDCAAVTDIGMRRANNQDSHTVVLASDLDAWRKRGHLLMVADGMGAHAAGELASKLAVDGVSHLYHKYAEESPPEALQRSIVETNSEIHRRGEANSDFRHMGTTGSVLLLLPQGALIAHIGDSRIYRLRGPRLEQLTRDHSLSWELRELGQIAAPSVPKNVITRSLGPNANVEADIEGPLPIQAGDTFLLCSDGLTGKIEDHEIAGILAHLPAEEAAHLLVNLANLRGGPDNITVIIARVLNHDIASITEEEPITIGSSVAPRSTSPLVWVGVAVCVLAALVLLMTHNLLPAGLAVLAGVLFAVIGVFAPYLPRKRGVSLSDGRRLGSGPYTQTACPPDDQVIKLVSKITRDLRRSVEQQGYDLDLSEFDSQVEAANKSEKAGNTQATVASHTRAVRVLMLALREEQNKDASDSAIEL